MPLWMSAGLLDWYWHKDTDIEHTAGTKESLIHLLMFTEVGLPILMGLLLAGEPATKTTTTAAAFRRISSSAVPYPDPDHREGLYSRCGQDRYTRHEVAALRVGGPSGRTLLR